MEVTRGGTLSFDENVRGAIHSAASPGLTLAFQSVTLLGSQPAIIGLSVGAALILFLRGRRDLALLALLTLGGAELLEVVLKIQFHRQRPEPFFATPLPVSYSFPSGHALLSCCCYGGLAALAGARVRFAAAVLILVIGISRVYLGVHHASDVIAGYLVAIVWMSAIALLYLRISRIKP